MVVTQANQPLIRMYAVFARETLQQMKSNEGKLAAQAGHAYLHAWWDAEDRLAHDLVGDWGGTYREDSLYYQTVMRPYKEDNDARKIALVVEKVEELEMLYERYRPYMGATLVEDCGYTIFSQNTITAVGLGPVREDWLQENDDFLKKLPLLRHEL